MRVKIVLTALGIGLLVTGVTASTANVESQPWKLFDRRVGLFVHWGLYAVDGWHEQAQWRQVIPVDEYAKRMNRFTMREFDPEKWLDLVEAAGMDYVVLTTKHHDGFCLWDTDETDYKVTKTPGGRDVVRALSDACRRRGIRLGLYYSIPDWHHPNAINFGGSHQLHRPNPGAEPDLVKYLDYIRRQVTELLTRYGPIVCFFWDISPELNIPEMQDLIRRLQPGILINPRGFGPGDYSTPERGDDDGCGFARFTEACDSVDAESWGYRTNADYHSVGYCARTAADLLSKGGNLLLNVGPDAEGRIPDEAQSILKRLGVWKKAVDEAWKDVENVTNVVSTTGCVTTRRGNTLYLTYVNGLDRSGINLSPLAKLPRRATLLNTGAELQAEVVPMPSNFNKVGTPAPASLHVRGIPVDDLAGMPVVIRLTFEEAI